MNMDVAHTEPGEKKGSERKSTTLVISPPPQHPLSPELVYPMSWEVSYLVLLSVSLLVDTQLSQTGQGTPPPASKGVGAAA